MLKISIILFIVVAIIFSTIYTPQAMLPTLQKVFNISILQTNLLFSGMLFILMMATPFYIFISKYFEKKKIMMTCIFFLFLAVLLSAFSTNYYILLISRVMQGVFIPGITAIMLSYVQEIYPKNYRGLGMGIYMSATGFGAVIGRLLAGWMTYIYSWREAFILFAILLVIALLSMGWGLPSVQLKCKNKEIAIKAEVSWYHLVNLKILSILLIPMIVFFSFMAITTFITYHLAQEPFFLNSSQLGNLFLILLLAVIVSPLAGKYSDKIGIIKILFLGIFLLVIGILATLSSYIIIIIIGLGLVTIGMFSIQSVAPIYLGNLFPHDRDITSILYQTFFYLGGTLGTFIPSIAWNYYAYNSVAKLCLVVIFFGILPFVIITLKQTKIQS